MQTLKAPPSEHQRFEQICERVADWETLPAIPTTPPETAAETDTNQNVGPLNDLILAGLVSPY